MNSLHRTRIAIIESTAPLLEYVLARGAALFRPSFPGAPPRAKLTFWKRRFRRASWVSQSDVACHAASFAPLSDPGAFEPRRHGRCELMLPSCPLLLPLQRLSVGRGGAGRAGTELPWLAVSLGGTPHSRWFVPPTLFLLTTLRTLPLAPSCDTFSFEDGF